MVPHALGASSRPTSAKSCPAVAYRMAKSGSPLSANHWRRHLQVTGRDGLLHRQPEVPSP